MTKQKKRTYEEKLKIVNEVLMGRSYSSVSQEFGVRGGTIANWKRKHLEGTLHLDRRGKSIGDVEDIEIIKKSYTVLMRIRRTPPKLKNIKL